MEGENLPEYKSEVVQTLHLICQNRCPYNNFNFVYDVTNIYNDVISQHLIITERHLLLVTSVAALVP